MEPASRFVRNIISDRMFPDDPTVFLEAFCSTDRNIMELQEGSLWDYKKDFPFSRSDNYFGGIVRLICAFHNTFGGLIIFGVDDTTRQITGNPVQINVERLNAVLRERLSNPIECSVRHYDVSKDLGIDVLLVTKRTVGDPPVRFSVPIGKYKEGTIYVRNQHEVLTARSADMPFLYGPRNDLSVDENRDIPPSLIRALPASPATVKEFVGRSSVMERLWHWLVHDDEPRTFLYGKGGSGKSTIAFEFAKLVARSTPYFKVSNGEHLDAVIFLSAKKMALDTNTSEVVPFIGNDFDSAEELFCQILVLSEWQNSEDVELLSFNELKRELEELMDTITTLIVVDDIDTLTTRGRDPGMDALYRAAIRARKGAKILYTLRNAPSHSLAQALEVPGLEDNEYRDFIRACCSQFNQPEPSESITLGQLSKSSERRPLVIEAVIGLRRTTGSYEKALELLQERAGDEIRGYLFDREYDALATDNRARYILAALSLTAKPLAFPDLEVVTRYNAQQLSDALGEITEMFLTVVHDDADETQYTLGQSTRDYITMRRVELDLFAKLRERVQHYTSTFTKQSKELRRLVEHVQKELYYHKDPRQALALLERYEDDPKVAEHPRYQALLGIVAASHSPPILDKARAAFRIASDLDRLDANTLRAWYFLERTSGTGIEAAIRICDTVLNDANYSDRVKAEFCAKKGHAFQIKGEKLGDSDADTMLMCFAESLDCNMEAYTQALEIAEMEMDRQQAWTTRCASVFGAACIRHGQVQMFFRTIDRLANKGLVCDPLLSSIAEVCHRASRLATISDVDRAAGVIIHFRKSVHRSHNPFLFLEQDVRRETIGRLDRAVENCKRRREELKTRRRLAQ